MENDDLLDELTAVVGRETAERLIEYYEGSNVYFSKRIRRKLKHQRIKEEFKNGASYKELCVKFGYGETHIREIIHGKERKNDK